MGLIIDESASSHLIVLMECSRVNRRTARDVCIRALLRIDSVVVFTLFGTGICS